MSLVINSLSKHFGEVTALNNISLEVPQGCFVCFLGPSGCGKTTLLRIIAGLEQPDNGEITLNNKNLSQTHASNRNFGVVFQSYSLFPNMTALTNVGYGLRCRRLPKPDIITRSKEMLALVQLQDQADKLPEQMSGGQQQRVALARALAPDPSLLLLDEPLSALDAKVREELRHEIRAIQQRLGVTTIMVTHDQEESLVMADLIVVMNEGKIEQTGTPKSLYEYPETAFVADFIGGMNLLPVRIENGAAYFGDTPVTLAEKTATQNGEGKIGVRPEALTLSAPTNDSAANHIPCQVKSITYLGNLTRVFVSPAAHPELKVTVELHGQSPVPSPGEHLALSFAPEALRLLT